MSLELIIAAGTIAFFLIHIGKDLKGDYVILQLFLFAVALLLCIIITKGVYDSKTSCDLVLNETIVNNSITNISTTSHTYMTQCYSNTSSTTSRMLYTITNWVVYIFDTFMLFYFVYRMFVMASEKIIKGRKS